MEQTKQTNQTNQTKQTEITKEDILKQVKKQLDSDPKYTERDKEIYMRRAEASHRIIESTKDMKLEPIEMLKVLMGLACGMTAKCDEPFSAIAYTLQCMSEYYKYYEVARHEKEAPDEPSKQ